MIIATITDVLGDVFIRKVDGTIANVVSGDVIVNEDASSQYRVAYVDNGGTMLFTGTAPQLFNPTMIPSHHEGSESVIDTTSANPFTPSDPANPSDLQHPAVARKKREEEDINSNAWNLQSMLDNQKKVLSAIEKGDEPKTPEGFTFGEREAQLLRAQEDLFDPRTGNQTRPNSGLRQAQFDENYQNPKDYFEDRTGQQTDVNSDLRNAKFLGARREYEEDGIFYGDNSDHETLVIPINRPPLAVADRNDVTVNAEDALGHDDGDATTTIIVGGTILGNDTDPDGNDTKTITSISGVDKGVIDGTTIGKYGTLLLNHDGTYTYTLDDSPLQMQALAVGETLTDTFTYTIVDRAGQFSSSTTLSIVIHGVNNVPVFTVSTGDSDSAAITETNTTLSTTGTLSIGDVDTTDTVTATSGGIVSVGGTYQGALPTEAQLIAMFGVTGGEPSTVKSDNPHGIVWSFNSGSHSFDPIPVGETVTLTYRVDATDNHGVTRSHDVTITITGTNDVPIAVADTNSVTEDAEDVLGHEDGKASTTIISGSTVLANDTDVDTGDTKTVSGVQAGNHNGDLSNATTLGQGVTGNYGTVIMNADGTYTYALNNNDVRVQHLASGEKLTDVFSYTAKDSQGATSTTTLTITINGTNDAPTITPVDGNDTGNGTHIGGQATVYEASLSTGSNPSATTETTSGTLTISAKDGLTSVVIGGTTISEAQLLASGTTPISITTANGSTLVINGFTPSDTTHHDGSGSINYTYTLNTAHTNGTTNDGNNDTTDSISLVVNDRDLGQSTGTLTVTIVDDVPTARADTNSVTEDTAVTGGNLVATGNVVTANDTLGADVTLTPVSGVKAGTDTSTDATTNVGSAVVGTYGSVTINSDGTYTYTANNSDVRIQHLANGETLTDSFVYTLKDADGDTSTTTLTITINGTNDAPTITPVDGNNVGNGTHIGGQATVYEASLSTGSNPSATTETTSGTLTISAKDGLTSVVIGGTTISEAQLLASGTTPISITTANGSTLVINGFTPSDTTHHDGSGSINYTYTLNTAHTNGTTNDGNNDTTDSISLVVNDRDLGQSTGTLTVTIVDDVPTAIADTNRIDEGATTASSSSVTGDVLGASVVSSTGDRADTKGADGVTLTGVAKGTALTTADLSNVNTVGSGHSVSGDYGSVVINADGTYTYTLDNTNLTVQGLDATQHLTDTFSYTIKDADGDISTTTLTITINGTNDGVTLTIPNDTTGTHNDVLDQVVYESGLVSGSSPSTNDTLVTSHFTLQALDGLQKVELTVGATTTTLTAADITALNATHTQTIASANGTLVLNSYSQAPDGTMTLGYTYTLTSAPTVSGTDTTDTIAIKAYDTDSNTDTQNLVIKIIDDAPTAHNNQDSVVEGASTITGNVITDTDVTAGKDVVGADGATVHTFTYTDGSGNPQTITFADANPQTVTTQDGSLTVNPNGTWSFTPNGSVNQPADATKGSFSYTLIDNDGDISTPATNTITVTDTAPTVGTITTASVNENDLPNGSSPSASALSVTESLSITAGKDTLDTVFTVTEGAVSGLTSNGSQVYYYLSTDLKTLIASTASTEAGVNGANTVFTDTLNHTTDATTTTHTFVLNAPIDHVTGNGTNSSSLSFGIQVTDSDGSFVTGIIPVTIIDDVPTAHNNQDSVVEGASTITGNVITDTDVTAGKDVVGADGATVHTFTYTDGSGNPQTITFADANPQTVTTQDGSLTVNPNGTWSFTPNGSVNQPTDATKGSFSYTLIDNDGDVSTSATNTITVTDTNPSATAPNTTLNENDLASGSIPTPADLTVTQTLHIVPAQDAISNITFDTATKTALEALHLTSGGLAIGYTLSADGHTLTATTNSGVNPIFTIALQNTGDTSGASQQYQFTLQGTIDHSSGGGANTLNLPFSFNVSDSDSTVAGTPFTISIIDDVPTVDVNTTAAAEPTLQVDETTLAINATANFAANFVDTTLNAGADGQASLTQVYTLGTVGGDSGLIDTATGQHIILSLNATTHAIEGKTQTSGAVVFTVSVDSATGDVTLDQLRAIKHADTTNPDDVSGTITDSLITLTKTNTLTDNDGDGATDSATINIGANISFKDDVPTVDVNTTAAAEPTLQVDETTLSTNQSKSFAANFTDTTLNAGADGQATLTKVYTLGTVGGDSGLVDTATGEAIILSLNATTHAIEGKTQTSGDVVFTVSVTSGTGNVTLDQIRAIQHANSSNPDDVSATITDNLITLTKTNTLTDKDGDVATDSATINIGSNISFKDDAPSAVADSATVAENATAITGNVMSNDTQGADGSTVHTFTYTDGSGNAQTITFSDANPQTVTTKDGSLTVNPNGTWSFTPNATVSQPTDATKGSFSYTLIDNDGDVSASATNTITVTDTTPTPHTATASIDEKNIQNLGSAGNTTTLDTVTTTLGITQGGDSITDVKFTATTTTTLSALNLTSGGYALNYSVSADGHTLTATNSQNGATVFTAMINNSGDATGATQSVTFTLLKGLDQAIGNNGANTLNIPLDYQVSDTDSSVTTGASNRLSVSVIDDVPIAADDTTVSMSELQAVSVGGNVQGNDHLGADWTSGYLHDFTYLNASGVSTTQTVPHLGSATVTTQYGSLTVNSSGVWSFTSTTNVSATVTDGFTYHLIDNEGDISASATQSITITDTVPTIAPVSQTIDETSLGFGATLTPTTVPESLTIGQGADTIADTTFDALTKTNLEALGITSDGTALVYTLSDHVITATKGAGGAEVFSITLTNPNSSSAGYDFKLSLPIDHTIATGHDTDWFLPFSVTTTDADGSTASGSFSVDVKDSVPTPSDQTVNATEDTSLVIRLSQDVFSGDRHIVINNYDGTGNHNVANGGTIDMIDPVDGVTKIGTLLNNGDGTVTFTPVPNYSNSGSTLPSFGYDITDSDGDSALANVSITVTPVADAPTFGSDNTTDHPDYETLGSGHGLYRIYTTEDTAVALGLKAPVVSDTSGSDGSYAERLSIIKLDSFPIGSQLQYGDGTPVLAFNNSTASTSSGTGDMVRIWLSDATNHINSESTCPSDAVSMTTAQFEALKILPPANSGANFDVQAYVKEYEVDSNGDPLSGVASVQHLDTIKVKVLAVTDPVTLGENSAAIDYDGANDGTLYQTIKEEQILDLTRFLSTSFNDLDGTEHRWMTITNPGGNGDIIVNGTTITAGNSLTIEAPNLSTSATGFPTLDLTTPHNASGTYDGITVTLSAKDADPDGSNLANGTAGTTDTLSSSVTLNLTVTPLADDVTLSNSMTNEDTAVTFLSSLAVNDTTGTPETITKLAMSGLPEGSKITYDGVTTTIGADGLCTIGDGAIPLDMTKLHAITFTPAGNSSADVHPTIEVTTNDIIKSGTFTHTPTIVVNAVAEVIASPMSDTNADGTSDVTINPDHIYAVAAHGTEDTWFNLTSDGFNFKTNWSNQDTNGTAEQTFALLTPSINNNGQTSAIGSQFDYTDASGTHTLIYTGTPIEIPMDYLDTVQFMAPANAAGVFTIDVQAKTIDTDPDTGASVTATSGHATLSTLNIYPSADAVMLSVVSPAPGLEDTAIALHIKPTSADSSEIFNVTITDIPAGVVAMSYNGVDITGSIVYDAGTGLGSVVINNFNTNLPLTITPPLNSNADFTLHASAVSVDTMVNSDGVTITTTSAIATVLPLNVIVTGVADGTTLPASVSITTTEAATDSANHVVTTVPLSTYFDPLLLIDQDGSETLTIKLTGLAAGFDLTGTGITFLGGTGLDRVWIADSSHLGTVNLTDTTNFSGTITFTATPITTEDDGNALVGTPIPLSVTVNPSPESTITLSATAQEDTLIHVDLSLQYHNGDTNETLDSVTIDPSTLSHSTLYYSTDGGTTLISLASAVGSIGVADGGSGTYTLSGAAINNLYVKGGDNYSGNDTFGLAYTITDPSSDGTLASTTTTTTGQTYTVNITPVTDAVSDVITAIVVNSGGASASGTTVTVTTNATFTVDTQISKNLDPNANGHADTDGSEKVTDIWVKDVPTGVSIVGFDYIGYTPGDSNTGLWHKKVIGDSFNTASLAENIQFSVDGSATAGLSQLITITTVTQDGSASVVNGVTTFTLETPTSFTGVGTGGVPATIDTFSATPIAFGEDTSHTLNELVDAKITSSSGLTINLTNLPAGTSVSNMVETVDPLGNSVWTATSAGGDSQLQALLNSISITPPAGWNSNNHTDLAVNITLTTYDGQMSNHLSTTLNQPITPITDPTVITINASGVLEDHDQPITITLNNAADGVNSTIINNTMYLSVDQGGMTANGILKDSMGVTLSTTIVSGVLGINDGTYYVITGVNDNSTLNFTYTPHSHASGSVALHAYVDNQETGASNIVTSDGSQTFAVTPVSNGLDTLLSITASGNEDTRIPLTLSHYNLVDMDGSEHVLSVTLQNVPADYLVFAGTDATSATSAANAGGGTWAIPVSGNILPAYIAILPPLNVSGDVSGITLSVVSQDGTAVAVTTTSTFDLHATGVADGIAITPTSSFGSEGSITPINLNSAMTDTSEIATLTIGGLGADATFYTTGGALLSNVTYDSGTSVYTLSNLTPQDVTDLGLIYTHGTYALAVSGYTTDGASTSPTVTGTFPVTISQILSTTGDDILQGYEGTDIIDGGAGNDTIYGGGGDDVLLGGAGDDVVHGGDGADNLDGGAGSDIIYGDAGDDVIQFDGTDSSIDGGTGIDTLVMTGDVNFAGLSTMISNVEKIDLTTTGTQTVSGLSLDKIFSMTESSHTLTIDGGAGQGDTVSAITKTGWTKDGETTANGYVTYNYHNDATPTNTVTVNINVDLVNTTNLH